MPSWALTTVISGGQTGADQGALRAAKAEGYETGGMVPKGWRTDEGPAPWLADYGCVESLHVDYTHRTRWNVRAGDGTVWFGKRWTPGHQLTQATCRIHILPFLEYDTAQCEDEGDLIYWLTRQHIRTLNVAGNRERMNPGIGAFTENILRGVLRLKGRGASLLDDLST
jgi:hypothetical protein